MASIRRWWWRMGRDAHPNATELFITADAGGSNGHRTRLWKVLLQKFVDDTGLRVAVAHYPPGASKWNKIEHRMFSFITQNWRGRPLLSVRTVVSLIATTTTTTGLKIKAALDTRAYDTAVDVADSKAPRKAHRTQSTYLRAAPSSPAKSGRRTLAPPLEAA